MPLPQQDSHDGLKYSRLAFWGFVAVAAFYLLTEHTAHVMGALPYLILLACPLMHLMHGHGHGHRHSNGHQKHEGDANADSRDTSRH